MAEGQPRPPFPENTRPVLLVVCFLYATGAAVLLWKLGAFEGLGALMFSTPDSKTYVALSQYLVGKTATVKPALVAFRPFLFPLFLSLIDVVGPYGFFVLQLVLNVLSVGLVLSAVLDLTGSRSVACAGAVVLASSPTFTLATLHALTMSLGIFLISSTVFLLVRFFRSGSAAWLLGALFALSAAVCVKPIFLPFLLVFLVFVLRTLADAGTRRHGVAVLFFVVAVSPVLAQLALTAALTGRPTISSAGRINFEHRFFPAVYGFATVGRFVPYPDPLARRAAEGFPTLRSKMNFLAEHPATTLKTALFLLRRNLLSETPFATGLGGSNGARRLAEALRSFSRLFNGLAALLHLVVPGIIVWWAVTDRSHAFRGFFLLVVALVYSVLLLSILTYWQGDRIVTACLPAWAVIYPAVAFHLAGSWRTRPSD